MRRSLPLHEVLTNTIWEKIQGTVNYEILQTQVLKVG